MNQKDMEILTALKPLETLFNALTDDKIAEYCKLLQPFDISVIREAVRRVSSKWTRVSFPPPGAIVEACEAQQSPVNIGNSNGQYPWEKRNRDVRALAQEYVNAFMRGSIAEQARAGGYENSLHKYVSMVASIQAQIIIPNSRGDISLSWCDVTPSFLSKDELQRFAGNFIRDCREQATRGFIDVPIGTGWLRYWHEAAQKSTQTQLLDKERTARKYGVDLAAALPPVDTHHLSEMAPEYEF